MAHVVGKKKKKKKSNEKQGTKAISGENIASKMTFSYTIWVPTKCGHYNIFNGDNKFRHWNWVFSRKT